MQSGDILYAFSSSYDSWRNLAGRAGYALARDVEIVDMLETMIN